MTQTSNNLVARLFSETVSFILAALDQTGFRIDRDTFPIAPITILGLDVVTHTRKRLQSLRRKARLNINLIREVLLVKARSIHCSLDIQPAIGCAQKNIGNGRDDAWSAG